MSNPLRNCIQIAMVSIILCACKDKTVDPGSELTTITWRKTYTGNQSAFCTDVLPADDGGYYIVGTLNNEYEPVRQGDVYLMKTDAGGNIVWEKSYGGERYDGGMAITETNDGGLVIAGQTMSFGASGIDMYLLKVDPNGNELWSKTFGGALDEWVSVVHQTTDGGYLLIGFIMDPNDIVADPGVAGYAGLEGRSNINLIKTDGDGNGLWSRTYDSENNILTSSGIQTPDGGTLILATILYYPASDNDIYLLKVDGNGNVVWSQTWEPGMSSGYDLLQTSDGNIIVTGPYSPPEHMHYLHNDYQFIKFDLAGNTIWTSTFGDPNRLDFARTLTESADGGFIGAGGVDDIVLVKIDENGQFVWEQRIDALPNSHSGCTNIFQHPDGGYVVAGSTFLGGGTEIFLIKTDSEGNVAQ